MTDLQQDELGFTHYTLQPKSNGRFAPDKEIKVHVNPQGEVVLVNGALNESMSDVFAYFIDNDDATIGEDVYTPNKAGDALRSMSNPNFYNQPATMSQYVNTTSDNGGVHTNSGIPNKIAYDTISQLGQDKAEKIYYRALSQYLTVNSNFADAKQALAQSAFDLYGQTTADTVYNIWTNAGVTE